MTRQTRRIILYGTVFSFLLVTPIMLLYAWGYSFDWQKKKPVLTGGFYFSSIPRGANVYLDNNFREKTPTYLKRLTPRDYEVEIIKEGYHIWHKKLRVESKLVTEARNILLIPLNPQLEVFEKTLPPDYSLEEFLTPETSGDVFYVDETDFLLYKTDEEESYQEQVSSEPLPENSEYEVVVSNNKKITALGEGYLYLLDPETKVFELIAKDVQKIQFSNDNKKLLYHTSSEIWVYYLKDIFLQPNKKAGEKELITRLSQNIKQAVWYGGTNEHIIFFVDQKIKIIELDNRDERNAIDIMSINADQMFYNSEDNKLYIAKGEEILRITLEE